MRPVDIYAEKKSVRTIILIILPVLLFILSFFLKEAGGPYYLNYYDPGYVYLVNSLNLMQMEDIGHTDHPGTSLQIFGAVILKIIFWGRNDVQILDTVFSNPELYLNILNKCLVTLNCIALFCLGIFVYSKTSNIFFSLLIQLSPFISFEIFYGLVIVSPENFLILSVLSLSAVLVYYVYDKNSDKHMFALSMIFAVICGFGSVSKLNFIPICLLPLFILKGLKYKLIFTGGTVLVFIILFSPALAKLSGFSVWAGNLILNSGIHGKTNLAMFDLSLYFKNIILIFSKDIFFAVIYLLIFAVLILSLIVNPQKKSGQKEITCGKERKVLFAILIAITFQILVVAKNYLPYAQYYIIPSLMFSIPGLAFLISYSLKSFKTYFSFRPSVIFIAAIIIVSVFSAYEISNSINESLQFRNESYKINNLIKEYSKSELVIPSVGTANEDCALALCTMYGYSGKRISVYRPVFSKKSSSDIFHNFWENKLFSLSDRIDIQKEISSKKKIIVQLMQVTTIEMIVKMLKEDYNINVKDWKQILKNSNGESIYEIYTE
ncbi:MAG: hypothetical protein ABI792_02485 [bacterium]